MKTVLARALLLAGVTFFPALAGNQILLRNLNSADGAPAVLAAGANSLFVISTIYSSNVQTSRVVQLDLTGTRLGSLDVPQLDAPIAAAVDSQGDVIIVGVGQTSQGLVVKVNSALQSATTLATLPATINAVALDTAGNIYLTGITSSASFPVTSGAYQTKPPLKDNFGSVADAFVTELSPAGSVTYSTYFGSDSTACTGGSFCIGKYAFTSGAAIAVDSTGAVSIAGVTTASGLPVTAGALAATCVCGYSYSFGSSITAGFAAKFQPSAAQQLVWSTYINAIYGPVPFSLNGMALDAMGNMIVGGSADSGLPTTAGAFQITPGSNPTSGAYLLKLNSTGTEVVWGTYVESGFSAVRAVLVDSQGSVVFSGYAGSIAAGELQYHSTFVGRATGNGATLTEFYNGPAVYYLAGPSLALTAAGQFVSLVPDGPLWIETAAEGPSLLNIANSASGLYVNTVGPLQLITLYGVGIGPSTALSGVVQNGVFTTQLGGYQVLIGGTAAPLLYAGSSQINLVVPGGIGANATIQIVTPTGTIAGPALPVTYMPVPGVFQGATGLAAALNQDGTVNSSSNPAHSGDIVTVFADANSGEYFPDGALVPLGVYDANLPVWVVDSYRSLEVVWAGAAPGIVNGVMQINFRLPEVLPAGDTLAFSVVVKGVAGAQSMIAVAQ